VTDREVLPGCAQVRTKCAEKTSVGLWGQSINLRELPGVTGPSHGVVGVLQQLGASSAKDLSSTSLCLLA
jgi:hypothetical protein